MNETTTLPGLTLREAYIVGTLIDLASKQRATVEHIAHTARALRLGRSPKALEELRTWMPALPFLRTAVTLALSSWRDDHGAVAYGYESPLR